MHINKDQDDQFLLSFSDILSLFRRHKLKILRWALVFGFLGAYLGLIQPIRYQAEGTFREKGIKSSTDGNSSVVKLLSGSSLTGEESEAVSLMISHKILKNIVSDLHLQANLEASKEIETLPKRMWRNLVLAWSSVFRLSPKPVLKDRSCFLEIKSLHYPGEIPLAFILHLKENGHYQVLDVFNAQQEIGWGKLGEPFQFETLTLTLVLRDPQQPIKPQSFHLSVNSLASTIKELRQELKVEPTKRDKSLLQLKCKHRDRFTASAIIDGIMNHYQNYLKTYQENLALNQLDYLSQRRDHLTENLSQMMRKHADYLAKDLYGSGFVETEKEIEFLMKSQHEFKRQLLDNELEIKRLKQIEPTKLVYYDESVTLGDIGSSRVMNETLAEMRILKQRRDALEIEVQKKSAQQNPDLQSSFAQQLKELKDVQHYLAEVQAIARQYEEGHLLDTHFKIMQDPRFLMKGWLERLQNASSVSLNEAVEIGQHFKFYLSNLERLFGVHERILQERLTHQQNLSDEYQGISLEVATTLYLDYSKQMVEKEGLIRRNLFFIKQIEDPDFEISSLSSGLDDQVSISIIQQASQLSLNLRDENNQSLRDQQRIKHELNLQRIFLSLHLKQMVQLMELHKQLIDEKIFALQNVCLELIHQRISLLEHHLQACLKSRLDHLAQERTLIQRHLESIHAQMALLPQKWVSEKLVTQEVETNRRIVEEIVKLVESKNISHKLEIIQSTPIDFAIPPLHPLPSKVFLFASIGFFLGGLMGSGVMLGRTLNRGLNVSPLHLELMGYHFAGYFKTTSEQLSEKDLDTLRCVQAYFDPPSLLEQHSSDQHAKFLLLLQGNGPHYAADLAHLFAKRGRRVLILHLTDVLHKTQESLLHYLQGEIGHLPIQKQEGGEEIILGGSPQFVSEILYSPAFKQFMDDIKCKYDWIFAVSHASPCSTEAEKLLSLFYCAAMTLSQETTVDLNRYQRFQKQSPPYQLTFILHQPN